MVIKIYCVNQILFLILSGELTFIIITSISFNIGKLNQLLIVLENRFEFVDLQVIINSKLAISVKNKHSFKSFCEQHCRVGIGKCVFLIHFEKDDVNSISLGLVSHFKTVFAYSINNLNVLFIFNIAICHCEMPNLEDATIV